MARLLDDAVACGLSRDTAHWLARECAKAGIDDPAIIAIIVEATLTAVFGPAQPASSTKRRAHGE